jgi:hypothetical protein
MASKLIFIASYLTLLIVTTNAARADVLLNGKDPVDHGYGDMIGGQIRWRSCSGQRKTLANPPYAVYKRPKECDGLGAMNLKSPEPNVFGLNCHASFSVGSEKTCTVIDHKLADYFLENVHDGDHVDFKVGNGRVTLSHGDDHVEINSNKWRKFLEGPELQ